jgi:hypothetical protein
MVFAVSISLLKNGVSQQNVLSIGTRINTEANHNIVVSADDPIETQGDIIIKQIESLLKEGEKFDAIICVAGGFRGGNAADEGDNIIREFLNFCAQYLLIIIRNL